MNYLQFDWLIENWLMVDWEIQLKLLYDYGNSMYTEFSEIVSESEN